jgi:hypothetical protein
MKDKGMSRHPTVYPNSDMRIGVSAVEHKVLDEVVSMIGRMSGSPTDCLLDFAVKAAQAALRAKPEVGKAGIRRANALDAAALLIVALEQMDAGA